MRGTSRTILGVVAAAATVPTSSAGTINISRQQNNEFDARSDRLHKGRRDPAQGGGDGVLRTLKGRPGAEESAKEHHSVILSLMEAHANGITTTGDHASTASMSGGKAGKATTPMSMGKSSKGAPNYPVGDDFFYDDNVNDDFLRATPLTYSTGKAGKTGSGPGPGPTGKSGKKRTLPVCSKRLDTAWMVIKDNDLMEVFGIEKPGDITETCYFEPPEEGFEYGLGCTNIIFLPGVGFTTNATEADSSLTPEEQEAFDAIVQYCDCFNAYEQGCAAAIPHGPPSSTVDFGMGEVGVNSYSEFIPFSSPAARAEYCIFAGIWNGDIDTDILPELDPTVQTCGCHWIGQARQMVGTCPGIELGAFFEPPLPPMTPTFSPVPTPSPPPEDVVLYSQDFDEPVDGVFPDNYNISDGETIGWLTGGGLAPPVPLPGAQVDRRGLRRMLEKGGIRRLQEDTDFNWMISKDEVDSEPNSISPPNLMNSTINVNMTRAVSFAIFVTGEDWGQGELTFDFMTDIELPYHEIDIFITDDPEGELVFVEELLDTEGEWDDSAVFVPEGRHYIFISYVFNPEQEADLPDIVDGYEGNLYIDNVEFTQFGTQVPTLSPTMTRMPTDIPTYTPTDGPTSAPTSAPTASPTAQPVK